MDNKQQTELENLFCNAYLTMFWHDMRAMVKRNTECIIHEMAFETTNIFAGLRCYREVIRGCTRVYVNIAKHNRRLLVTVEKLGYKIRQENDKGFLYVKTFN